MKEKLKIVKTNKQGVLKILLFFAFVCIFSFAFLYEAKAQNSSEAKLFMSPSLGSFLVGSTFDVSIILDTDDTTINAVEANLTFPADKLQIVTPSTGKSFISIWLEQPSYSNVQGTISFSGGTPDGINTSSGIVSTITFRVIKAGEAVVSVSPSSSVLAHDGKGTEILAERMSSRYTLKPKPPKGPLVFSQTHPSETNWHNNNNPVVSWEKEDFVTDFSFILDSYPQTVPDNTADAKETTTAFEDLADGLWYFHIKAKKSGIWGGTTHFLLRIDTSPPASFEPKVNFLLAAVVGRAFVSFSTTDALSGIDHYEIAITDKTEQPLESPIFVEAESPYQLPRFTSGNLKVMVRAIDNAGNIREEWADADFPTGIKSYVSIIIFVALALIVLYLINRFSSKYKFFAPIRRAIKKRMKKTTNND